MEKQESRLKHWIQLCIQMFLFSFVTASLHAQYTLSDDDVVVADGVITSCSYSFELKSIIIPGTLDGQTVTGIGNSVFQYEGITSVTLPTNLETIGNHAFNSNNIADLDLSGCTSLKTIGDYAFYRNDIEALDLSSCTSLLSIGGSAFRYNTLTSFTLPEVTYNGTVYTMWKDGDGNSYNAGIDEATNLSSSYQVFIVYTLSDDDVVVEEGIITSSSYNFELKNITIPGTLDGQTVTGISSYVFPSKGITSLTLPTNLETIASSAFGSNALFEISLPASLTLIESYAFNNNSIVELDLSNCTSLASIGSYAFGDNKLESLELSNCTSLTSIENHAFNSNNIADLDLSGCTSLKTIGDYAFYRNHIEVLDLSSCTSLLSIGSSAFRYNPLTSFTLPEVTYNGTVYTMWKDGDGNSYNAGIDEATNLSTSYLVFIVYTLSDDDVVVEEGIITSSSYNFELKNIVIPDTLDGQTVTGISSYIFPNKGITSLILPSNLENIASSAFGSNALFEISLPASLTSIESYAFNNNSIVKLDLSNCTSLASIGRNAFSSNSIADLDLSRCTSLISIGSSAFSNNSFTSFVLPDPVIQGYILNYWEDDQESIHIASEQVTNLYTGYTANIVQFPVCLFFAEFLEVSQTVDLNLKFNVPDRGMEVSGIVLNNNSFNVTETMPMAISLGDTSFSISLDLISPETNLHTTSLEISYILDGQAKTYSDSLYVAIILEDSTEISFVGKKAIDSYHACLDSNDVAAQNNKGVIYRLLGGYNKAEEIFNEVVSEALVSYHGYTGVKMNQGVVKSDKEISAVAMEYYSNALGDLTGEESTSVLAPQIYYNQAWEHLQSGDFNESRIKAHATIDHDNSNDFLKAKAYVLLGVNEAMLGDTITAIDHFENAIDINPESCIADIAWEDILILQNLVGSEYVSICQGEKYLGWEESGQYSRELQSQTGGDSIAYTFLSVNPVYNSTENISICEGTSYNGWTASGQYTENLITSRGCDSIITTNLIVNPTYSITKDTTMCEGESYNGWTSSGLYSDSLVTSSGCDSVIMVNLSVVVCTNTEVERTSVFSVYPNPNNGSFRLLFEKTISEQLRIEIINTLGEKIYIEEITGDIKEHNIHLRNITRGLYLITVRTGEMKVQRRILIL